ncbi:MAG: hypothetical protein HQL95_12420 [Magnetococcales bacterium]|nr:hypothetical protein [Magnetococcales bacterium]
MIVKTLRIVCDLFDAVPHIGAQLGTERYSREFLPRLLAIRESLSQGPNPEFGIPVVDALEWGFHAPIQPILDRIIDAHGFDWRIVTGRRRRFPALAPGQPVPNEVLHLWQQAMDRARVVDLA